MQVKRHVSISALYAIRPVYIQLPYFLPLKRSLVSAWTGDADGYTAPTRGLSYVQCLKTKRWPNIKRGTLDQTRLNSAWKRWSRGYTFLMTWGNTQAQYLKKLNSLHGKWDEMRWVNCLMWRYKNKARSTVICPNSVSFWYKSKNLNKGLRYIPIVF